MWVFCFPSWFFRDPIFLLGLQFFSASDSGFEASSFDRIHGTAVGQPGWEDGSLRAPYVVYFRKKWRELLTAIIYILISLYLQFTYVFLYIPILMNSVLNVERRDSYPTMS